MKSSQSTISSLKDATIGLGLFTVLLWAFALVATGSAKPAAASSAGGSAKYKVTIDNFKFSPATLTVPVGAQVTWTNRDDVPHTVASTEKKFSSQALDTDEQFSFTFADPGTYEYYCSVHPKMTAKIIVQSQ